MRKLFAEDRERFSHYSLNACDILLDYSKNRITQKSLDLLIDLAQQENLQGQIDAMFKGDKINFTEQRAVLHSALRSPLTPSIYSDGIDVQPQVHSVLGQIEHFVELVHQGKWRGYSDKPLTQIINIGIGGSDLGPLMVTEALKPYAKEGMEVFFVSNVDATQLSKVLEKIDPERALFIVASKTFTTQETLTNANSAKEWLLKFHQDEKAVARHFVALSTNLEAVSQFGIDPANSFAFWDWVGGRYSLWSAIGLSIALYLGMEHFNQLLAGAHAMDQHFQSAPLSENLPVTMGLLAIWYSSFFGTKTHAILPYDQYLHRFPAYLQQAIMESNGKQVDRDGNRIDYQTSPVIWGEPGTNGQHAFYQLIHQGTQMVTADFIAPMQSQHPIGEHHQKLLANCFAQAEALMRGRDAVESRASLINRGKSPEEAMHLHQHLVMPGNRPSNTLLFDKLSPYRLGSLIAAYEHRIFVEGAIWRINSFDQWGVELGKEMAGVILPELTDASQQAEHDSSTQNLIQYYHHYRQGSSS